MPELPKLSQFTKLLAQPEAQIESMLRSAGIPVPPGPMTTLYKLQEAFERGESPNVEEIFQLPRAEEVLARLPAVPPLPTVEEAAPTATVPEVKEREEVY